MNSTNPAPIGIFVKTGSPQLIEVLGTTALDFVVLDAEHAPFDRGMLDLMVLGGRAARLPVFIRIPAIDPAVILSCLDMGATGLLVPHVDTAEQAREVVAMARYRGGRRGYSGGPRSAGYASLSMAQAVHLGDQAQIVCQIESAQAVGQAQAIAEVPGVAGPFLGPPHLGPPRSGAVAGPGRPAPPRSVAGDARDTASGHTRRQTRRHACGRHARARAVHRRGRELVRRFFRPEPAAAGRAGHCRSAESNAEKDQPRRAVIRSI